MLTVPAMALLVGDGKEFCYVVGHDRFERRPVKATPASHDLLEVIEGLSEGEEVVLEPNQVPPVTSR